MIDGAEGSKNNKVYNNTIINPADSRWTMLINNGSTEDTLYNNIFINDHFFYEFASLHNIIIPPVLYYCCYN